MGVVRWKARVGFTARAWVGRQSNPSARLHEGEAHIGPKCFDRGWGGRQHQPASCCFLPSSRRPFTALFSIESLCTADEFM